MLSPDGKHFAAIQSIEGKPAVALYALNSPPGTPPSVINSAEWIVDGIRWAKNDRLLVKVKRNTAVKWTADYKLVHTWGRTISVGLDGKQGILLFENNAKLNNNTDTTTVSDIDLSDTDNIYMPILLYADMLTSEEKALRKTRGESEELFHLTLYRVNVHTGETEKVISGDPTTRAFYMDGDGHVIARVDRTKRPLVDHLKLYEKGDWQKVGNYDASGNNGAGIVGLTEDGSALVQEKHAEDGTDYLARLDLATGASSVLYANPDFDVARPVEDHWTGRVIEAVYTADRPEFHYFDAKRQALQRGLEKAFPGLTVHAGSSDVEQKHLIVAAEGPRQPITYYYLDRTTHQATLISSTYPDLTAADLGEMKPYPYKARDGLDIPAYITLPPGRVAKNLPAVVMPHGGPDARDSLRFDWWAQFLANRGYAVLQPNYRGSSGYGRKFTKAGLHQWGRKMQDDISDGVRKIIADGIVDPKRICIVGASYGGYAALAGAAFTPDLYACAASFAGVSDLPQMLLSEHRRHGEDSGPMSFWTSRIGSPFDDTDELRATSPARHADRVKCPILLMHGEGDTTVPIEQSEVMESALKDAGKSVQFIRFPGEDHYFTFADTRITDAQGIGEIPGGEYRRRWRGGRRAASFGRSRIRFYLSFPRRVLVFARMTRRARRIIIDHGQADASPRAVERSLWRRAAFRLREGRGFQTGAARRD